MNYDSKAQKLNKSAKEQRKDKTDKINEINERNKKDKERYGLKGIKTKVVCIKEKYATKPLWKIIKLRSLLTKLKLKQI